MASAIAAASIVFLILLTIGPSASLNIYSSASDSPPLPTLMNAYLVNRTGSILASHRISSSPKGQPKLANMSETLINTTSTWQYEKGFVCNPPPNCFPQIVGIENLTVSWSKVVNGSVSLYTVALAYNENIFASGNVSVLDELIETSQGSSTYQSFLAGQFAPLNGKNLNTGDAFGMNFSSPLGSQLDSLYAAVYSIGSNYISSSNSTLATLGHYYHDIANGIHSINEMIPKPVSSIHVVGTVAVIFDDFWTSFWSWVGCLGSAGMEIFVLYGFLVCVFTWWAILPCLGALIVLGISFLLFAISCAFAVGAL